MSKFVSGLLGAAALLVTVGAAQFAVGQNLPGKPASQVAAATMQSGMVNRAVKGDQPADIARETSKLFVTQVSASNDTSVAMRVQRKDERRESKVGTSRSSKRPVACEASASVLTEVAKLMESARCVT